MKHLIALFLLCLISCTSQAQCPDPEIQVGMSDTTTYFPLLEGKRVAVLANRTSVLFDKKGKMVHLVDLLHRRANVVAILSPEHGFRTTADAGQAVDDSTDPQTGIPIRSLYNGHTLRPKDSVMHSFDVLVIDLQDVGLRFYTYYISMLRMMQAAADFQKEVIVLDRPNPNGDKVEGPILDPKYKSGVGQIPIPILHGLTMGEIALMAQGEGWVKYSKLTVVACRNYTHARSYTLPIAPSPNLATQRAIYLYASLCPMEGTPLSVGRGTAHPFECFGHPNFTEEQGYTYCFTPQSTSGASNPPLKGIACRGVDLSQMPLDEARQKGFSLQYLIQAYHDSHLGDQFFTPMFEKLIGVDYVRRMIQAGATEEEIRRCWLQDLEQYRSLRAKYLIYE